MVAVASLLPLVIIVLYFRVLVLFLSLNFLFISLSVCLCLCLSFFSFLSFFLYLSLSRLFLSVDVLCWSFINKTCCCVHTEHFPSPFGVIQCALISAHAAIFQVWFVYYKAALSSRWRCDKFLRFGAQSGNQRSLFIFSSISVLADDHQQATPCSLSQGPCGRMAFSFRTC
jgi:hypothetical protein